ncbi:MAG: hypothetical protein Q8880_03455 [Bacteroidota bacterium]|nr:hypothetical protein [Bacteroidota bacterium]
MNWEKMYDGINDNKSSVIQNTESPISLPGIIPVKEEERNGNEPVLYSDTEELNGGKIYQLRNRYIMKEVKEGLMLIDQERAHERILYEKFQESLLTGSGFSQQVLFPNIIEFNKIDFELLKELKEDLLYIGIDISEESENKFSVNGIPPELKDRNIKGILEEFLEKYKNEDGDVMTDKRDKLAKSMARSMSIKSPRTLTENEMNDIIEELFTCKIINKSPYGKTIFCLITNNELELKFN